MKTSARHITLMSWKNRILDTPMYTLVDSLKTGNYNGMFYYAPLNISKMIPIVKH